MNQDQQDNPLDDLLDAINRLTQEYRVAHMLHDDDTGNKATVKIRRDGLLKQLRASIIGGIGAHEGGTDARERMPIDAGALELYNSIEANITEWYVGLVQKPVGIDLEHTLREWFIVFKRRVEAKEIHHEVERATLRKVEGWVHSIEGKFNPAKKLELTVNVWERDTDGEWVYETDNRGRIKTDEHGRPRRKIKERRFAHCPLCEQNIAWDPRTGDRVAALVVEYREEGPLTVENSTGLCRACTEVWKGGTGVRQLSWSIQQEEDRLNATEEIAA